MLSTFAAVPMSYWLIGGAIVAYFLLRYSSLVVFVGNDQIGVVEKLWSFGGSVAEGFLARHGEAGFRPAVLRGGFHFFFPFQYRVHRKPLVMVPQGSIGYVFARGGAPLAAGQTLGNGLHASPTFEDAGAFLASGGQRGPQRLILREGTYAINTAQFVIFTINETHMIPIGNDQREILQMRKVVEQRDGFEPMVIMSGGATARSSGPSVPVTELDADGMVAVAPRASAASAGAPRAMDSIGVVTVHDGPPLDHGEIIAPTVGAADGGHNGFQNPDAFLALGGRRGRQEQVLVDGTYYINRLFATVELKEKTTVDIGKVGVVVSYTGQKGEDTTGEAYRYGELVETGRKGVWRQALQPGKYPLNPYALKVVAVPTTNFVLRWIKERSEVHGLDENLAEVKLITRDAFEPILPLSIVLHIAYDKAPLVIQRFGDVKELVEQTLDPMVSAYFKDAAQNKTLIELISKRSELQAEALQRMRERFAEYSLDLKEVMIGTPRPQTGDTHIATILDQLRARQVAEEQIQTYNNQSRAAEKQRELRQAEASAEIQGDLTRSEVEIAVRENQAKAELAAARQQAEAVKVTAGANAERIKIEGAAEANRVEMVGVANATATEAQVRAFGGPQYQLSKDVAEILAKAILGSKIPLVPQIAIGGGGGGGAGQGGGTGAGGNSAGFSGHGGAVDALLGLVLAQMNATRPAADGGHERGNG